MGGRTVLACRQGDRSKEAYHDRLWTDACLTFPALDALKEGYAVYPVVDAVGGTSTEAHRAGLERIVQAGARPIGWVQLLCEHQRDWLRKETAGPFAEILFAVEGH